MKNEITILEKKLKKTREEKRLDKAMWKREAIDLNWHVEHLRKWLDEATDETDEKKEEIKSLKKQLYDMKRRHAHDREILQDYIDAERTNQIL